jgi:hypothetical protein
MLTTLSKVLGAVLAAGAVVALGAPAAGQDRTPAQPRDGSAVRGTLASVDVEKNTVTVEVHTFDRKTGEGSDTKKTFPLAKDAKILQDDVETKLSELRKGNPVVLKLDKEAAVSVSVVGGIMQGEFHSANPERNTITVIAGRNLTKQVFHLVKTTTVTGPDGKPIAVQDLKPGMRVQLTRSVEDENTAIRVQVVPAPAKR